MVGDGRCTDRWLIDGPDTKRHRRLTPAETEIAEAVISMERRATTARRMEISPKTYDTLRGRVIAKMGLSGRANTSMALLLMAMERGWLPR